MWLPSVAVGVIKDLAPPCSLCFPQTIAAMPQMFWCVCLQSFPSSRGMQRHRVTRVWDRQVPGTGWELILLAETLGCSSLQMRDQCHIPVLAHPAAPATLLAASSAASAAAGIPGMAGSRAASPSPPEVSPQPHTRLSAGTGVDCPSGPAHSHGWSASSITSVLA